MPRPRHLAAPIEVIGTGRHNTEDAGAPLRPGSIVRMPVGTLGLGVVVAVLLVGLAYWVGFVQGRRAGEQDQRAGVQGTGVGSTAAPPNVAIPGPGEGGRPSMSGASGSAGVSAGTFGATSQLPAGGPRIFSDGDDPRKEGLNYMVLATYDKEESVRLAQYLWRNGVECGVFPRHNDGLFHVVDLKGFTGQERSTPEFTERQNLVRELGRAWKAKERGPSDLSDMWPALYKGDTQKERKRT